MVQQLINHVDQLYIQKLITSQGQVETDFFKDFEYQNISIEELRNPAIFIEYPKELAEYKKMLKNWIMMNIEKRKRLLKWDINSIPLVYKKLELFAQSLLNDAE